MGLFYEKEVIYEKIQQRYFLTPQIYPLIHQTYFSTQGIYF